MMSHTGIIAIITGLGALALTGMFAALERPGSPSPIDQSLKVPSWETKERWLRRCAATLDDPTFVTNKRLRDLYDKYCR